MYPVNQFLTATQNGIRVYDVAGCLVVEVDVGIGLWVLLSQTTRAGMVFYLQTKPRLLGAQLVLRLGFNLLSSPLKIR